jgi:hypothetical protein
MMQSLLADRFRLASHYETQQGLAPLKRLLLHPLRRQGQDYLDPATVKSLSIDKTALMYPDCAVGCISSEGGSYGTFLVLASRDSDHLHDW